jgi:AraC-like DNA-binding protein
VIYHFLFFNFYLLPLKLGFLVTTEVILPSVALRPYVHHYWIMKTNDMSLSHIIMPVGNPKLIFHRKRPFDINGVANVKLKASIIGPYDKAIRINTSEDLEMITVFLMPYAAKMITGIPCYEFSNDNVDLEDLESVDFKELKARILEAETTESCIGMIEDFIIRQLTKTQDSPYLNPLMKVFNLMANNPEVRINELASAACLSERQFRRVFIDNVGMKPKQIQRIQRFHLATNEIIKSMPTNIDRVLYKYGYTDHSHFNREFHDIANISPTEYIAFLDSIRKQDIMSALRSYHAQE